MREAIPATSMLQQRAAIARECFDSSGIIPDRIIDVVGVFLLVAPIEREALHGEKRRNRGDGDHHLVGPALGHIAFDRDELMEMNGKLRAGCTLGCEFSGERRPVLLQDGVIGAQEINDHIDRRSVILRLHRPDHLEISKRVAGGVTLPVEGIDKSDIFFAGGQSLCVETEVYVECADVAHLAVLEQQPRHGAADNRELPAKAAQCLANLNEHRLHRGAGAIVIVCGRLRFVVHEGHRKSLSFRCSAPSTPRSPPAMRSR